MWIMYSKKLNCVFNNMALLIAEKEYFNFSLRHIEAFFSILVRNPLYVLKINIDGCFSIAVPCEIP